MSPKFESFRAQSNGETSGSFFPRVTISRWMGLELSASVFFCICLVRTRVKNIECVTNDFGNDGKV